jgi:predicted nucleotidyltransferase
MGANSTAMWSRQELVTRLRALFRRSSAQTVYLFGSWGRGTADAYSDVDLVVIAESERPFVERYRDFPAIFHLPFAIELFVYRPREFKEMRRKKNRFIQEVLRTGLKVL